MQRPPSRRRLLAAAGGAALAGCLDAPARGERGDDDATSDDDAGDDAGGGNVDPTGDLPTSTDDGLPGACPEYDRVDRLLACDGDAPLVLEPSARSLAIGGDESIDVTLRNDADERFETNFYDFRIDKYVDGEWFRVAPRGIPQPLMHLDPGEEHVWPVTADNEGIADGDPARSTTGPEDVPLRGVGAGGYAFRARGWFESEGHENPVAVAATFELEGGPVRLTPTDDVVETEWDGETLVARSGRSSDLPEERTRRTAFELERVGDREDDTAARGDADREDARPVITEQVLLFDRLRDVFALAHRHDADSVRLEGERAVEATTPYGAPGNGLVVSYQGSTYELRTRVPDAK